MTSDRRRMRASFAAACAVYLPVTAALICSLPEDAPPAAGTAAVALSFTQLGETAVPAAVAAEPAENPAVENIPPEPAPAEDVPAPQPADEEPPKTESLPEPEPEPEPVPEPLPNPEPAEPAKPEPVVKPRPEPKPEIRPAVTEPRKKAPKPRSKPVTEVRRPVKDMQSAAAAAAVPTAANPNSGTSGPIEAKREEGVSTLVYGESNDAFLLRVRETVEAGMHYPRKARAMRLQGAAVVQFIVEKDGAIREIEIRTSSGHDILDRAALRAVVKAQPHWGSPNRIVRLRFPIRFELTG